MQKMTAVSLFSGAGGLDAGFEKAVFKSFMRTNLTMMRLVLGVQIGRSIAKSCAKET